MEVPQSSSRLGEVSFCIGRKILLLGVDRKICRASTKSCEVKLWRGFRFQFFRVWLAKVTGIYHLGELFSQDAAE